MKSTPFLLALLLCACASLPEPAPRVMLDEQTGVSLSVVAEPIVLARDRRDLAAHARDYLTLVAVERNQAGRRNLMLLVYRWSTIDRRVNAQPDAAARQLVLVADGRDVPLRPVAEQLPAELRPRPELLQPDVSDVDAIAYRVDREALRVISQGSELLGFFADARGALPFRLWADGRAALARFAEEAGEGD